MHNIYTCVHAEYPWIYLYAFLPQPDSLHAKVLLSYSEQYTLSGEVTYIKKNIVPNKKL